MSLRAEVDALGRRPGPRCAVARILGDVDGPTRAELLELLVDVEVDATALARALTRRGHAIGDHSIGRHRRGDCACAR